MTSHASPEHRMHYRTRGYSSALCLSLGLLSCTGTSVCEGNIDDPSCPKLEIIKPDKDTLYLYQSPKHPGDNSLTLQIKNRRENQPLDVSLELLSDPTKVFAIASVDPTINAVDSSYKIVPRDGVLEKLALQTYSLIVREMNRMPARAPVPVRLTKRKIAYTALPPFVLSDQASNHRPMVEQLGFVSNTLIALASGVDGSGSVARQIQRYPFDGGQFSLYSSGDYFSTSPFGEEALAAFSGSSVFLLNTYKAKLALRTCGLKPDADSDCPLVDMNSAPLPADTKALAVSPDGTLAVRGNGQAQISYAKVVSGSLTWSSAMSTVPAAPTATMELAMGDLNGDGSPDLIALWQESDGQQVRVFLGNGSLLTEDATLSTALMTGLGTTPVTALALGDVDTDGYADVIVGRGLELAIVQNLHGPFVQVWNAQLDSSMAGPQIAAVAAGHLDGSDPGASLDIVAASNTPYDTKEKSTLFLHAFRPQ